LTHVLWTDDRQERAAANAGDTLFTQIRTRLDRRAPIVDSGAAYFSLREVIMIGRPGRNGVLPRCEELLQRENCVGGNAMRAARSLSSESKTTRVGFSRSHIIQNPLRRRGQLDLRQKPAARLSATQKISGYTAL
jgi:hypothetical protein